MNWYKKAQIETLDSTDLKDKGKYYTDYGHDIYYEEENRIMDRGNPKYKDEEPNFMWIFDNGNIKIRQETVEHPSHRSEGAWGMNKEIDLMYTGRYSPSEKIITVIPPYNGISQFRGIPKFLQYSLQRKFPKAEKIVLY